MHPYRTAPQAADEPTGASPAEEWVLAFVLTALGAARVAIAVVGGEELAADVTLAAILGVIGIVLLGQLSLRALHARS